VLKKPLKTGVAVIFLMSLVFCHTVSVNASKTTTS